ncbi:MAG: hemerythrin domain-containing protein, partial [Pseudonocardiaceae bacterium]
HMAEEEDDALADFRRNAPLSLREDLGRQFLEFKAEHSDAHNLDASNKDPQGYVNAVQAQISSGDGSNSLGIGSLKGR